MNDDRSPQLGQFPSPGAECSDFTYSTSTQDVEATAPRLPLPAPPDYPIAASYEPLQWAWDENTFEVLQALQEWNAGNDANY